MRNCLLLCACLLPFLSSAGRRKNIYLEKGDSLNLPRPQLFFSGNETVVASAVATDKPFNADKSGKKDSSGAIEKALKHAESKGGGIVYLPQGEYKLTQPLTVPEGVELRGPLARGMVRQQGEVCTLALYPQKGEKRAAINLSAHSGIRGLSLVYPEQSFDVSALVEYPWTIQGNGAGCWAVDLMLLNLYKGIDLALVRCDNAVLRGIWGSVFRDMFRVGGGSEGVVMEHLAGSYGPWKECIRTKKKMTKEQKEAVVNWFADKARHFIFYDCSAVKAWGLVGFACSVQMVFNKGRTNGKGCQGAEFWHCMYDVAIDTTFDAKYGANIDNFAPFLTNHHGQNYAVLKDTFKGPINFYAPTVQHTCYQHAWKGSKKRFNVFNETTLVTGKKTNASSNKSKAKNVVDRDEYTYWEGDKGDWVEVDLGSEVPVVCITLISAWLNGEKEPFIVDGRILVSRDGENYETARAFKTATKKKKTGLLNVVLKEPVTTRYVRVRLDANTEGSSKIRLAELRVYATLPP